MRRYALLAMLAALCVAAAVPASAAPKPVKAKVVQVVDGDNDGLSTASSRFGS